MHMKWSEWYWMLIITKHLWTIYSFHRVSFKCAWLSLAVCACHDFFYWLINSYGILDIYFRFSCMVKACTIYIVSVYTYIVWLATRAIDYKLWAEYYFSKLPRHSLLLYIPGAVTYGTLNNNILFTCLYARSRNNGGFFHSLLCALLLCFFFFLVFAIERCDGICWIFRIWSADFCFFFVQYEEAHMGNMDPLEYGCAFEWMKKNAIPLYSVLTVWIKRREKNVQIHSPD